MVSISMVIDKVDVLFCWEPRFYTTTGADASVPVKNQYWQ